MGVFYMTCVNNTTFYKLKKTNKKKHPVYQDKSEAGRNVVTVIGTLIRTMIRTIVVKF